MKTLAFIFLLLPFLLLNAGVRYVSKTGLSTPPYLTWETAADSIQKCLDICDNGDTVYVGNGVYHESLILNKNIWLIGISMDSTVIDGTDLAQYTITNPITIPSLNVKNFTILGKALDSGVAVWSYNYLDISYCRIKKCRKGIDTDGGLVDNVIVTDGIFGIAGFSVMDTGHFEIRNSIVHLNTHGWGIDAMGGHYKIHNNMVVFYKSGELGFIGIDAAYPRSFEIKNNLISGFNHGIDCHARDTSYFINNVIIRNSTGVSISSSSVKVLNNLVKSNGWGLFSNLADNISITGAPYANYNLLWGNINNYYGNLIIGDSNKIADPMVIKEDSPDDSTFSFDFHLQKYSPAIDKGDPSILDLDGSRSDIGLYGGLFGETYAYQDFAPRAPGNLTAAVVNQKIELKWSKNTEADTGYYNIYRDTVPNFTIDSTKLISRQKDTLFTESLPKTVKKIYYKLTAEDNQGNISQPSEEKVITYTSAEEKYEVVESYQLFQNYPNPFNPSTTISYRLKERGYVKLMVYDIKGELIKVLVNKEQESGYYETEFDASSLASGIYIYRIEILGKGDVPVYLNVKKSLLIK